VHSALCGVVFCLDFDPFFFLLLLPCRVFFLSLFIYLTNWDATNELLVGKMAATKILKIFVNSLLSFLSSPFHETNKGQNGSHRTSQNSATLYCFSLFSFQQTNNGIHVPHTPLDRGPHQLASTHHSA
jgi:hypothetical protein